MRVPIFYKIGATIATAWSARRKEIALETAHRLIAKVGSVVIYGPFKGLEYPTESLATLTYARKIFGTYESELHETFEQIRQKKYDVLVDIGAAEGFYAVGLSLMFSGTDMYAFEARDDSHSLCTLMAELNGVKDTFYLGGLCTSESIQEILGQNRRALIVADCTGCELEILKPDQILGLRHCDIVMELHDFENEGITVSQMIASRFSDTHRVEIINVRPGAPTGHIDLSGIDASIVTLLFKEQRHYSIGWAFLESKESLPVT